MIDPAHLELRLQLLEAKLSGMAEQVHRAIEYRTSDPHAALNKIRAILEKLLRALHFDQFGLDANRISLDSLLSNSQLTQWVDPRILARMRSIQVLGNLGSHLEQVDQQDAERGVDDLIVIIEWYVERNLPTVPADAEDRLSEPIRQQLRTVRSTIEALTKDQYTMLVFLRSNRRVAIGGCAGSGKTLLAAEKASRCDAAGLKTLVLCHSPNLANYLRKLLAGTAVEVFDVAHWLGSLTGAVLATAQDWTHFHEPAPHEFDMAFGVLQAQGGIFDAIIVDEGQDFRPEFWLVIEAAMKDVVNGFLYVFYDDNQALVPRDWKFPLKEAPFVLSKNCRNAGAIYEQVRRFHAQAPAGHELLKDRGIYHQVVCTQGGELEAISSAILEMVTLVPVQKVVVLTTEADAGRSRLNGLIINVPPPWKWQDRVTEQLRIISPLITMPRSKGSVGPESPRADAPKFSNQALPTELDVKAVAQYCTDGSHGRERARQRTQLHSWVGWSKDGRPERQKGRSLWVSPMAILEFFRTEEWLKDLPVPQILRISAADVVSPEGSNQIPLYSVGAFKGLEADGVVVFARADAASLVAQLYVAFSRARLALHAVIDNAIFARLPQLSKDSPSGEHTLFPLER